MSKQEMSDEQMDALIAELNNDADEHKAFVPSDKSYQRMRHESVRAITQLRNELDRMHAIVERLPKDATGKPIVYGDRKWWLEPGETSLVRVTCEEATLLPEDSYYRIDDGHTHRISIKGRGANAMNGELFDTRAAAEAARNQQ